MDTEFFRPFIDGTLRTLNVQCATTVSLGKPFMKGQGPKTEYDIAALIAISSSSFSGSMALCLSQTVFLGLIGKMLGDKIDKITEDVEDGAGELLNMIFGHAKRDLNAKGHDLDLAIPSIVRGNGLETRHLTTAPVLILPFSTEFGFFHIEICAQGKSGK